MSTIIKSFKQAELALAAYSNLAPGISGNPYTDTLEDDVGMSSLQAAAFASKWTVLDQYTPTEQVPVYANFGVIVDYVEQYTGLSVTVFEEVATGKRYLAIRGTEPSTQLFKDFVEANDADSGCLMDDTAVKALLKPASRTTSYPPQALFGSHCAASHSSRRVPPHRYTCGASQTRAPAFLAISSMTPALRAVRGRVVSPVQGVCLGSHWKRAQLIDRQSINSKSA